MTQVYDYVIIGSGFGGSVSALRLAEKGYSVLILEKGKRFEEKILPNPTGNIGNTSGCLPSVRTGFCRSAFSKA